MLSGSKLKIIFWNDKWMVGQKENYGTCTHATHLKTNMEMSGLRYICTIAKIAYFAINAYRNCNKSIFWIFFPLFVCSVSPKQYVICTVVGKEFHMPSTGKNYELKNIE